MTFLNPIWFLLAVPLGVSLFVWKLPTRTLRVLRAVTMLLIVLAMCGTAFTLPSRTGIVVVVADRSLSMPPGAEDGQRELIEIIRKKMGADDKLGVVAFGQTAAVERAPQAGEFSGFAAVLDRDASNLADGIEKALSLIPLDSPAKIFVLSDGHWTGKDPNGVVAEAASRGIAVDFRAVQRGSAGDVAVSRLDAPSRLSPGESFVLSAWVQSPTNREITYELLRGDQVISSGKRAVASGLTRLAFRDTAGGPGNQGYRVRIVGDESDPIPENNQARVLVGVEGSRPLLCVTADPAAAVAKMLEAGGVKTETVAPDRFSWTIEDLAGYSGVLLENVPGDKIGGPGMENLAAWVTQSGAGLMMTGGKTSFGPGGYFRSPLEPVLPVSMELRREHRKLALSIVVALDRSGSMAMTVPGGRTKMDLANLGAVQVFDLLSPMDEFGCIAVDSAPHVVAGLASVDKNSRVRNDVLRIDSQGGGIFVFEALAAAAEMQVKAKSGTKHIILFADASDSEEPGAYKELLARCRQSGITVSVIGLGTAKDSDADLLRDVAAQGGGRVYFTDNPEELPRLFAQDTFVVARNAFVDQETRVQLTGRLAALAGRNFGAEAVDVGGFNLCYLRPGADLAALTTDEYKAPVVASWQSGIGRVLAYTGEMNGSFTGPIAGWPDVGPFFSSLARWTAGTPPQLGKNALVTHDLRNGVCRIQLHLDPDRDSDEFQNLPKAGIVRGVPGGKPVIESVPLQWTSSDTLAAEIQVHGNEAVLATVEAGGLGVLPLPPVVLPYSSEYQPRDPGDGLVALDRIAKATGGTERLDPASIWTTLPKRPRVVEIGRWLLLAAILTFFLEVLERRTRLVSEFMPKTVRLPKVFGDLKPSPVPVVVARRPAPSNPGPSPSVVVPELGATVRQPAPATKKAAGGPISDALAQARRKARDRTER